MSHSDDIPVSALQHWLFCPRQYALIHIERIWTENTFTAEGRLLHERADSGRAETRPGIRVLRAVEIRSDQHGLHGVADVVELRGGRPYPVEYKRGKPKAHRADEVQLCAEALCLEEMFDCHIAEGALFYGQTRRRNIVVFDDELRALTCAAVAEVRASRDCDTLPVASYKPDRCDRCSLLNDCRPRIAPRRQGIARWLEDAIAAQGVPE